MSASESDSISQMEVYMGEEKRDRDAEFSFMKEKIKEQPPNFIRKLLIQSWLPP